MVVMGGRRRRRRIVHGERQRPPRHLGHQRGRDRRGRAPRVGQEVRVGQNTNTQSRWPDRRPQRQVFLRSPPTMATNAGPASPLLSKFDSELLRGYVKKLLSSTLQGSVWPHKDRDRTRAWCKEIGERVKERMIGRSASFRCSHLLVTKCCI